MPRRDDIAVRNVRELLGKKPVLGICLGHQLLALALGGRTYTHKNLNDGSVEGFAVPALKVFAVQHHPEAAPRAPRRRPSLRADGKGRDGVGDEPATPSR